MEDWTDEQLRAKAKLFSLNVFSLTHEELAEFDAIGEELRRRKEQVAAADVILAQLKLVRARYRAAAAAYHMDPNTNTYEAMASARSKFLEALDRRDKFEEVQNAA